MKKELKYFLSFVIFAFVTFAVFGVIVTNHNQNELKNELQSINSNNKKITRDSALLIFFFNPWKAADTLDLAFNTDKRIEAYNQKVLTYRRQTKNFLRTCVGFAIFASIPYVIIIPFRLKKNAN